MGLYHRPSNGHDSVVVAKCQHSSLHRARVGKLDIRDLLRGYSVADPDLPVEKQTQRQASGRLIAIRYNIWHLPLDSHNLQEYCCHPMEL